MQRCADTRVDGQPCRAYATWESDYCPIHARKRGLVEQQPASAPDESLQTIEVVALPTEQPASVDPVAALEARMQRLQAERDEAEQVAQEALGRANRASIALINLSPQRHQLAGAALHGVKHMRNSDKWRRLERLEVIARPREATNDLVATWLETLTDDELNEYAAVMIGQALSTLDPDASRTAALAMTDAELYGIIAKDFVVPSPAIAEAKLAPWQQRYAAWVAAGAPRKTYGQPGNPA